MLHEAHEHMLRCAALSWCMHDRVSFPAWPRCRFVDAEKASRLEVERQVAVLAAELQGLKSEALRQVGPWAPAASGSRGLTLSPPVLGGRRWRSCGQLSAQR